MATLDFDAASSDELAAAGVTRLRPSSRSPWGCLPLLGGMLLMGVLTALVIPVSSGGGFLPTLGVTAAGVILLLPLVWASSKSVYTAWYGIVLIAGIATVGSIPGTYRPEFTWVIATSAGLLIVFSHRSRSEERQRLAEAEGVPPGPRALNSRDVGVRAVWNSGSYDYEAQDPDPELAAQVVDSLDGGRRTTLTVFHSGGRLDISGDARERLLVRSLRLQNPAERYRFYAVDRAPEPASLDQAGADSVDLFLARGPEPFTVPLSVTADAEVAHQALTYWLETGQRDPDLTWHRDEKNKIPTGPLTEVG